MKAKSNLVTNYTEIEQALQLNFTPPEPEFKEIEINFDLSGVTVFYVNVDGNINISLFGEMWTLTYSKELHEALDIQVNKKSICNG